MDASLGVIAFALTPLVENFSFEIRPRGCVVLRLTYGSNVVSVSSPGGANSCQLTASIINTERRPGTTVYVRTCIRSSSVIDSALVPVCC